MAIKKESRSYERLSVNLLSYNKLLRKCTGDINSDSPTSWASFSFAAPTIGLYRYRGSVDHLTSKKQGLQKNRSLNELRLARWVCRNTTEFLLSIQTKFLYLSLH